MGNELIHNHGKGFRFGVDRWRALKGDARSPACGGNGRRESDSRTKFAFRTSQVR